MPKTLTPNLRAAIACRQVSGVTGTTTTIIEHASRLAARGWEVHVFGEDLDSARIRAAGASPRRLPRLPLPSYPKRRVFAWLFERAAPPRRYSLVWGHGDTLRQDILSLHNCVHAAHQMARGRPLPESSGVGRIHRRILEGRAFRLLIANSGLMAREARARFGIPEDLIRVIRPGHDPSRFRPSDRERLGIPMRRELGLGDGEVLIGLITSGDFVKRGVPVFLEALAKLPPACRAMARAVVIGKENRAAAYEAAAAAAGWAGRIRFLPPAPDVERWYHALDIYAHPALYEEYGQSVAEAMACGLPVVTTARVGASELLAGEAKNTLAPEPRPAELAARLARLIADPEMRRRWGSEAAAAVSSNTWDANFQATWGVIEEVLRTKRPARSL